MPCVLCLLLLGPAAVAHASDNYWIGTTSDWFDANNWSLAKSPTYDDIAYIYNGGTAIINRTGAVCEYLYLGNAGSTN